ncbi:hypothetical protein [Actinopolymorpha pittospori]|uniref:Uncharacterized protein n=1 Tax=Actinopolymorpha pittospori TaxID=648752 RepID=A0A927RR42_9ACTN|nr:hypothetical protein [Actinopolymorpha pittospori]MBE1612933.1 hypothetical protein [Actinopolymorpha pittospori]
MSADKKQDRARIEQAASAVATDDYPHLRAALQYAKDYTSLGPNAFGSVPSRILMPRYNPARESQIKNLEDGLDRLAKMIAGMNEVAFRMAVTEKANTIDLTKTPRVPVTKPDAPKDVITGFSALSRLFVVDVCLPPSHVARIRAVEMLLRAADGRAVRWIDAVVGHVGDRPA